MGSCLDRGEVSRLFSSLPFPSPLFFPFPLLFPPPPLSLPFSKKPDTHSTHSTFPLRSGFARWPCGFNRPSALFSSKLVADE
jgi:hypothetical protein